MTASSGSDSLYQSAQDGDPRLSGESLFEISKASIGSLLNHLIQANLLAFWCEYLIDTVVQQTYGWRQPDDRHLYWWLDTESEAVVRRWLDVGTRRAATQWHLSVATAYFSAANAWYASELEDRYVSRRHAYELAHCQLVDCGGNHGLALDLSLALEAQPDQQDATLARLRDQVSIRSESISLADIGSGIPQVLAGSPPGEWLPPFHNGSSWILLQVQRHERPSLQELAPRLLREAMLAWRQQRCQELATHWLQVYGESQAAAPLTPEQDAGA